MGNGVTEQFIAEVRNPNLYLSQFVPNSEKGLPVPRVAFAHLEVGGYYCHPTDEERWVGSRPLDCRRGLIVVDVSEDQEEALAHEWRHHWQKMNGWKYDGVGWDCATPDDQYNQRIKEYFQRSRSEMDALLFSRRVGSETLRGWLDLLEIA